MTERQFRYAKEEEVDLNKIQQGCEYIFTYLDKNGFSLLETRYLISSMGHILKDITRDDPLRRIAEFNYSASVGSAFSRTASSKNEIVNTGV